MALLTLVVSDRIRESVCSISLSKSSNILWMGEREVEEMLNIATVQAIHLVSNITQTSGVNMSYTTPWTQIYS